MVSRDKCIQKNMQMSKIFSDFMLTVISVHMSRNVKVNDIVYYRPLNPSPNSRILPINEINISYVLSVTLYKCTWRILKYCLFSRSHMCLTLWPLKFN